MRAKRPLLSFAPRTGPEGMLPVQTINTESSAQLTAKQPTARLEKKVINEGIRIRLGDDYTVVHCLPAV